MDTPIIKLRHRKSPTLIVQQAASTERSDSALFQMGYKWVRLNHNETLADMGTLVYFHENYWEVINS